MGLGERSRRRRGDLNRPIGEEAAIGFRRVAVDPVEIGGRKLVMGLNGPAMRRRLREPKLRLGSAFVIFLFFLRHLTWIE